MFSLLMFLITFTLSVNSAPVETPSTNEVVAKPNQNYDLSQFDEIYDQRQNGTENWRVSVHKFALIYTPPGGLLTAALLADPSLYEEDLGDFFSPESSEKPSTTKKPDVSTSTEQDSSEASTVVGPSKRKLMRIPGYLRPFVRRHHTHP